MSPYIRGLSPYAFNGDATPKLFLVYTGVIVDCPFCVFPLFTFPREAGVTAQYNDRNFDTEDIPCVTGVIVSPSTLELLSFSFPRIYGGYRPETMEGWGPQIFAPYIRGLSHISGGYRIVDIIKTEVIIFPRYAGVIVVPVEKILENGSFPRFAGVIVWHVSVNL